MTKNIKVSQMGKFKLINLCFETFLLSILFIIAVSAKSLPPGTGEGDVPSNVLILLDRSFSMSECMAGGDYMCNPDDIAANDVGDVYIIQWPGLGLVKLKYDTLTIDATFADAGVYETTDDDNCRVMSTTAGYGLVEYYDGYVYSTNTFAKTVIKIDATTGTCEEVWDLEGNPQAMTLENGHLFIATWAMEGGATAGLSTINLETKALKACAGNNTFNFNFGIAVDGSLNNLYQYFRQTAEIRRYELTLADGNYCPSQTTPNAKWNFAEGANGPSWGFEWNVALRMHPSNDNVMFVQTSGASQIGKANLNATKDGFSSWDWVVGRSGGGQATANDLQLSMPWGLGIDNRAGNEKLMSAGWLSGFGVFIDFDGKFLKSTDASITRMDGAKKGIKNVINDKSLAKDINFGFGYWSDNNGSKNAAVSGWVGSVETGRSLPTSDRNGILAAISRSGKDKIIDSIDTIFPGNGTDPETFASLAKDYYNFSGSDVNGTKVCPLDITITCQKNYVIVIGDGDFSAGTDLQAAKTIISNLASKNILTVMIGYGPGLTPAGRVSFNELAVLGDPKKVLSNDAIPQAIFAKTPQSLKTQLSSLLSGIISKKFSFTAPAISATIQEGGSLFQATFDYRQNKEWKGTLKRKKIDNKGEVDETDSGNWSVVDQLPSPEKRKIWTVLTGDLPKYSDDYNNFHTDNFTEVSQLFSLAGHSVGDYHRATADASGSLRLTRCKDKNPTILDSNSDDIKGLIEFIRGTDYFDYAGDCDLTKTRAHPFGEIYHSELIVVGPPNAETSFNSINQEAYWRNYNNYINTFKIPNENREKVIYVGSNSGALHAIKASTGKELWAFIPPFIAAKLPEIVNINLNSSSGGGSTAIYGVDGSPTVHDMYFLHPIKGTKQWATILIIPYGRGGAGFSVLDITNPIKPLHLYSIFNDQINHKVHHVDHEGTFNKWGYIAPNYTINSFNESKLAKLSFIKDSTIPSTCPGMIDPTDGLLTTSCAKGHQWTLPVAGLTKNDVTVTLNEVDHKGFNVSQDGNDSKFTFSNQMVFQANPDGLEKTSEIVITIKPGAQSLGVTDELKGKFYDYSTLAETLSSPRIFRMPNKDAPDTDPKDDIYVAVMGAGQSTTNKYAGSSVFVINLEDTTNIGKIEKKIALINLEGNGVNSSTPATPTVVTADTGTSGIRFTGALVYQPDFEGKITKINLTNMKCDNGLLEGDCPLGSKEIKRYDSTVLFNAGANTTNRRFMFHALDASIGATTSGLWLFNSTGDFDRINDTSTDVDNLLFGIRDRDFPKFKKINKGDTVDDIDNITNCKNTTNDETGEDCPDNSKRGWYIHLKDSAKGSAEPTVFAGRVYFPIYKPDDQDKCSTGKAYICAVDDECGTNKSINDLNADDSAANTNRCKVVGTGILSRIVVFANRLFANLSGNQIGEKDMISIKSGVLDSESVRDTWRENY